MCQSGLARAVLIHFFFLCMKFHLLPVGKSGAILLLNIFQRCVVADALKNCSVITWIYEPILLGFVFVFVKKQLTLYQFVRNVCLWKLCSSNGVAVETSPFVEYFTLESLRATHTVPPSGFEKR